MYMRDTLEKGRKGQESRARTILCGAHSCTPRARARAELCNFQRPASARSFRYGSRTSRERLLPRRPRSRFTTGPRDNRRADTLAAARETRISPAVFPEREGMLRPNDRGDKRRHSYSAVSPHVGVFSCRRITVGRGH